MAAEKSPERSTGPSEVTITVTVLPPARGRVFGEQLAGIGVLRRAGAVLTGAIALAALAVAIATGVGSGSTGRTVGAHRVQARADERAAISAAFGYPYARGCLTITVSAGNPDYARANVDRAKGCGRYHGYVNASFHRVAGAWMLVLDEGQQFVPNSLLAPCRAARAGCAQASGAASGEYEYRPGCFSLAIALHDARFAHADFDRLACPRSRAG